jgi:D-glycero-D-manno-heptose 1,7-bisphosphate phosphatase
MAGLRAAVFLDRDGVINRALVRRGKPAAPRRLEDFRLLPGAAAAVRDLKAAGLAVIVITNQPDIGNGLVPAEVVEAMHRKLRARIPVDDILVCPHRQDAGCNCRKPRPGLILAAASRLGLDPRRSAMVGDRMTDVMAGQAACCYTVLIRRRGGYPESRKFVCRPDATAGSLRVAVGLLLHRLSAAGQIERCR